MRNANSLCQLSNVPSLLRFVSLLLGVCIMFWGAPVSAADDAGEVEAKQLVKEALEYWRGQSSKMRAKMVVHRADWSRETEMRMWTVGLKKSLIRFIAPVKEAGNASLKIDHEMWSFSPKVNRIVKIPSSMMGQSWMGSDFSYKDLSKADEIVTQYTHTLISADNQDGYKVFVIEALPKENAPVVWGKEVLRVREDRILLEHEFYDQDMKLIKRIETKEIGLLGGKLFATVTRMQDLEQTEKWTEVSYLEATFGEEVPEYVFTLSNLRNPRDVHLK